MDNDTAAAFMAETHIAVFEETASATEIGVNVAWFSGSLANNLVIFIDQLKGARPWDDPGNTGRMAYDANGYPTLVPDHYVVSQLLIRSADLEGIAPHTGMFRLYGRGTGEISLISSGQGTLVNRISTRGLATEVIDGQTYWYVDVDFSTAGEDIAHLRMLIHTLGAGDHIRDMALVHHTHLEAHRAGDVFAPELIADLQGYGTLRLMDWMRANRIEEDGDGWGDAGSNWTSPDPEQRYVGPEFYTFNNHAGGQLNEGRFEVSVPIEHVVALANAVNADPWINLPVDISDARAAQLASYVATHLENGLTARWEYGNELFNDAIGFEGYRYAIQMAHATFDGFDEIGAGAAAEWAAYRGPQVYDIIRTVHEQTDTEARFVAPGWAFSGSLRDNGDLDNGYLVRYFHAEQAQRMNDGTPLPLEVVTDYTVAMYYGGTLADGRPDAPVVYHILDTVEGADTQAEILAAWLLFGADPARSLSLGPEHLVAPMTGVSWRADLDIAVTRLIWADIQAGLDPLTDLAQVLRLDGASLLYRGATASDWTTVAVFDAAPDRTLEQMIADVRLVGFGGRLNGKIYEGLRAGLVNSAAMRLDPHAGYAQALGLHFVAYEGGSHVSYPVNAPGAFEMYDAFNNSVAGGRVFARWLEMMSDRGLEEYMHFMSHSRTSGNDWWGVQDYIGQDVAEKPEAIVLQRAIAAYDPTLDLPAKGPLEGAEAIRTTPTGDLILDMPVVWQGTDFWQVDATGAATETGGTIEQLRLARLLPVVAGASYRLSLDIALDAVPQTELRVIAQASGGVGAELLRFQGPVQDGETLSFDLGEIPGGNTSLTIVVQRVGQDRSGAVTVANADVAELRPVQDGRLNLLPPLDDTGWRAGPGWTLPGDGTASLTAGATGALSLADLVPVAAGGLYTLVCTVALEGGDTAELRVVGRAMGGGADEVLRWRGPVRDGQTVTLPLDPIPAGRDLLDIILRQGGVLGGGLSLTAVILTPAGAA